MTTKTLSPRALSVIDQYLHFRIGAAVCSVPYFNNKIAKTRASLPVRVGKGSPKEISEEVEALVVKNHVDIDRLADESLKKLLVDNNIGIDCSGFAYYVLDAESEDLRKGSLRKNLRIVRPMGFFSRFSYAMHPEKNVDVALLADDKNSQVVSLKGLRAGDLVTMMTGSSEDERNHVLIIHNVDYEHLLPVRLHYSHAIGYPEDGLYGSGIKQGVIEITEITKPITEQRWIEGGKTGGENRLFMRAHKSKTELRRLKWF
jgi:hypothetical protein